MSAEKSPVALIEAAFEEIKAENAHLAEQLTHVQAMIAIDDAGWSKLLGGISDDMPGLSLEQLQEWNCKIQENIVGNPLIKRGAGLRGSYVWSKGVKIPGANDDPGARRSSDDQDTKVKRGRKTNIENFYRHARTQAYLLGPEANDEMERSAVASGMYLLLCDDKAKRIDYPIPLDEIIAIRANPDYNGEVWAYLREWEFQNTAGTIVTRRRWIYTDRFEGDRKKSMSYLGKQVEVMQGKTLFDQTFNSQTGWPLGIPDGLAAVVWSKIYSEMFNHGKVMTESLAKFAFKVTQNTQKGAQNVGVQSSRGGSGKTAVVGENNDLTPLSSAGKTYEFNGLRPIAAMVATSLEVSIVHLLSDPGAAGSSYGSASNLDLPTKRAMVSRQNLWASYIERILEWATGERVRVTFPPLDDDPYRAVQALALIWNTGLVHGDEMRDPILELGGITSKHPEAPKGVLLPNNRESWERSDIDPKDGPATSSASPDQGQSNGGGGTDSSLNNDERTDTIGEMLKRFSDEAFLDRLEEIAARIEAASNS